MSSGQAQAVTLVSCAAETDTIISWTDHELGHDIALSFASLETCEAIW